MKYLGKKLYGAVSMAHLVHIPIGAYRVKPKIQVMLQREILPNFRRGELRLVINTEVEKKFDFPFMYVDLEPVIRHFQ